MNPNTDRSPNATATTSYSKTVRYAALAISLHIEHTIWPLSQADATRVLLIVQQQIADTLEALETKTQP
jgi:hypothetical protein